MSPPLPPVGTQVRDVRGIVWDVIAHTDDGRARLAAVADPEVKATATAERLGDFEIVRDRERARRSARR